MGHNVLDWLIDAHETLPAEAVSDRVKCPFDEKTAKQAKRVSECMRGVLLMAG